MKHSIDLTPDAPLPNGLDYHRSLSENEKIKRQIQELLEKEAHLPNIITLWKPNHACVEEIWVLMNMH
jgi:hypothetical protein